MQAKPAARDQWLSQPFPRGGGVFMGRITPTGERLFYFRSSDSTGKRPFLPIGPYRSRGVDGLSVAEAYERAVELSGLYRGGIRDLREHLAQVRADAEQAAEDERVAAAASRLQADEQARAAAAERDRRISVRTLFDRWRAIDLQPQHRADGRRTGRKDGGRVARETFDRHIFRRSATWPPPTCASQT